MMGGGSGYHYRSAVCDLGSSPGGSAPAAPYVGSWWASSWCGAGTTTTGQRAWVTM
jgi:hypothetical protein